ncbi:hypothetical protein LPB86_19720 [Pedobacter sp. MC2016-14]|uniref:hypothetical protein n=1 Tax=Pedobacter sp. MC2016-14 TaxID=2897327 RepID=UPI001E506A31|nr:hypothetical protein [Pedobacter sp. MC2016-14]MCD0490477.1 hypothetical protein [Pedobacter sp. MC2016-14]
MTISVLKKESILALTLIGLSFISFAQNKKTTRLPIPQEQWQEHWWEHDLLVSRVYYDDNVAFYYDKNMDTSVTWPFKAMSDTWAYVKKTYGDFGPDPRLYVVFHKVVNGKLAGGHPSSYFNKSHDYHNTLDCGLSDWTKPTGEQIGMPIHEIGHIVTGNSHGVNGSPSDALWGDSKFMEIFNYDVLMNIGRKDEAERVFIQMQTQYDDFPRSGSQWFKNWFYPIYEKHGKAAVLNTYFELLARNFPKDQHNSFTRNLNWGEFIHFWSAAAGVNLKKQAELAFGWSPEWEKELKTAQHDFPLKYK